MYFKDKVISFFRGVWYGTTEPVRLSFARMMRDKSKEDIFPLVSVLIPTHNRMDLLLERCLPSVLGQSYENLEIIVAAHDCSDGTQDAIGRLDDLRVRCIPVQRRHHYPPTPENRWFAGPVEPLNAALDACSGKWIARIDDDDEWTPDHIETLLYAAVNRDYEFVSAAHETHKGVVDPYIYRSKNIKLPGMVFPYIYIGGTQTWLYRSYLKLFRWNPDCWRKSWNRVNDTDIQDRMLKAGVKMGYLPKVLAKVYPRPGETEIGLKAYQQKG